MASLLVCLSTPFPSGDARLDAARFQRGDVIAVQEDGHPWADEERNRPGWIVLDAPGLPVELLAPLLLTDPHYLDATTPNPTWRLRPVRLGIGALAAAMADTEGWAAFVAAPDTAAAFAAGVLVRAAELPA